MTLGAVGIVPRPTQAPELSQYRIERQSPDKLHDIEVYPLVLAHAEDGHNVGVVQTAGGLGLTVEADQDLGIVQPMAAQHLQGNATAQRLLLSLVHDSHSAPADFPQEAKIAQA